jgi:methionyl-tRNA formyltransferase
MQVNNNKKLDILFIGKENDPFSKEAANFVSLHFDNPTIVSGKRGDAFPEEAKKWKGDLIISYLSQWIIPKTVLENARMAALNFHPGPPEYPGIGCTNFAIYNNEKIFGVTCHHMEPKVDTGKIVSVKRFPVFENDTVFSITHRCYASILSMFYEIFYSIMKGEDLPQSNEVWKRKPYLRKELNDLCRLTPDMSVDEIERRIKATHYITDWAYFEINDKINKISDHNKEKV